MRLSSCLDGMLEFGDHVRRIFGTKDGRTSNNDIGACICRLIDCCLAQSSIDLNVEIGVSLPQSLDFWQFGRHELLTTKAWVDRHDENHLHSQSVPEGFQSHGCSHVWHFFFVWVVQDIPQHIDRCLGLNSDTGKHLLFMHIADHLLWAGLGIGVIGRVLGGCGGDGGFIVEAVQIASRLLEVFDPLLGLLEQRTSAIGLSTISPRMVELKQRTDSLPRQSSCGSRRCPSRMLYSAAEHGAGSW